MIELLETKKEVLNAGNEFVAGCIGRISGALGSIGFKIIERNTQSEKEGIISSEIKLSSSAKKMDEKAVFKKPFISKKTNIKWRKKNNIKTEMSTSAEKLIDEIIGV